MAQGSVEHILSERAQALFKALVERYIRDGQPVGSRTLAREAGLDVSPATVRNVMADLEEIGLVHSPHTSAGRVPTVRGYRFFVDSLLTIREPQAAEVRRLQEILGEEHDPNGLVRSVSDMLSGLTRLAGVVTVPRREHVTLRHIEFLRLSEDRVLAILVVNQYEVQNRIIHVSRPYTESELQQAANYLNAQFTGDELPGIKSALLREMHEAREDMDRIMRTAVEMAEQLFRDDDEQQEDYVVAGQTNLMEFDELSDVEKLRQLFDAFNRKRDILLLLDQCIRADGVQIFIGEESGYKVLDNCSVVTAPYSSKDGDVLGVVGVIGPTRMPYQQVIPIVDVTAKLFRAALNQRE